MWLPASFSIMNLILIGFLIFYPLFIRVLLEVSRNNSALRKRIFFSLTQIAFVPSVPLPQAEFLLITSVFVPLLYFIDNNRLQ